MLFILYVKFTAVLCQSARHASFHDICTPAGNVGCVVDASAFSASSRDLYVTYTLEQSLDNLYSVTSPCDCMHAQHTQGLRVVVDSMHVQHTQGLRVVSDSMHAQHTQGLRVVGDSMHVQHTQGLRMIGRNRIN